MPTIVEVDGTRIMMFPFDQDPPHIPAFGADFRAKLAISDAGSRDARNHRAGGNPAPAANGYSDIAGGSTSCGRIPGAATRSADLTSRSVHRIIHAQGNPDFSVDLRFEDGRQARVNLSDVVQSAAVAAPFRDPARFVRGLKIVAEGDVLRWSDQFELHADSLRYRAFPDELVQDYGPQRSGRGRPAA